MSSIVQRLRAQVAARPGDPLSRAELAAALHEAGAAEADGAWQKARELVKGCLQLGLIDPASAAAELLHRAFARPDDALLLAEVSAARQGSGDLERARRLVEAVVAAEPDALPARIRAAAFALGAGEAGAARRWIEPVAHESVETSALYVQTLLAQGDTSGALSEIMVAIERYPEAAVLWELLGAAALERNRPDTAIDAFAEVLRLAPERPQAHYNLALAFVRAGSRMAALGVIDAGLEVKPHDSPLMVLRQALLPKVT